MKLGYARISTDKQDLKGQTDLLKKEGCTKVYTDIYTGKKRDRPKLKELMNFARKGDTIVVYRFDRLSRNVRDLLNIIDELKKKGIHFKSVSEKIDTNSAAGKLQLHMFAMFSEFEVNSISERTKLGLAAARARGRKGGRPTKMTKEKIEMAKSLHSNKKLKVKDILKQLGVGRATYYKMINS